MISSEVGWRTRGSGPGSTAPERGLVRAVVWGLGCVFLAGCGGVDEGAQRAAPEGTPRAVEPAPVLQVGVETGDPRYQFHQLRAPFLLPDDRVAVPLGADHELRIFGADGAFVESLGRQGEGPGEFVVVSSAWSRGDTIEVADGRLRRVTRFLPDGTVEVIPLRGEVPAETMPHGALPGGWVAGGITDVRMNSRDQVTLHAFAPSGEHLGAVASTEGIERIALDGGAGLHPLSPRAVVRVGGGRVYVGETLSPRLQVFDLDGTLVREISWDATDAPVPGDAMRLVREHPEPLPLFEHLIEGAPVPDRVSVFWDFLVDELGFVWVRPFDPARHAAALGGLGSGDYLTAPDAAGGGRWLVLSSTGELSGEIEVPAGLRPTQVLAERLVGVHVDELGIERVQVHALSRH